MSTPPHEPKRNSGRTGRRRLSPAELAVRDPQATIDHVRRYGVASTAAAGSPALPGPPAWFTPELWAIWVQIIEAAPIGMLTAADHPAVVAYALTVFEHDRLARAIVADTSPPSAVLSRQLRLLAGELRSAATHLGLSVYQRSRLAPPPPLDEPDEFARFDLILADGTRVPHNKTGGRFR
jgi:hypothetical protein